MRLLLFPALLVLASCGTFSPILEQGDDLSHRPAVENVVERLRGYEGPRPDTDAFLAAFDSPSVDARAIWPIARDALDRHDDFVRDDESLAVLEARIAFATSENIRRTLARVARVE